MSETADPSFVVAFTERLRADLLAARKARDPIRTAVLRTTLAAVANAEAPAAEGSSWPPTVGLGGDAERLVLGREDVAGIVAREIEERATAAAELEARGRTDEAERLRAEAAALDGYRLD